MSRLARVIAQSFLYSVAVMVTLAACTGGDMAETTPAPIPTPTPTPVLGHTLKGAILQLSLEQVIRLEEVAYTEERDADGRENDYVIRPSSGSNELVVVRVKVGNHADPRVQLDIEDMPPELHTDSGRYHSVNTYEAGVPTDSFHPVKNVYIPFIRGSQRVEKGFELDGWLIFDVPKGSVVEFFKWSAGGEIIIDMTNLNTPTPTPTTTGIGGGRGLA